MITNKGGIAPPYFFDNSITNNPMLKNITIKCVISVCAFLSSFIHLVVLLTHCFLVRVRLL